LVEWNRGVGVLLGVGCVGILTLGWGRVGSLGVLEWYSGVGEGL
jgi:hypothetical protein